jgi:hypothetical protein
MDIWTNAEGGRKMEESKWKDEAEAEAEAIGNGQLSITFVIKQIGRGKVKCQTLFYIMMCDVSLY